MRFGISQYKTVEDIEEDIFCEPKVAIDWNGNLLALDLENEYINQFFRNKN